MAIMFPILHSRSWYYALLRIALLSAAGWWLLQTSHLLGQADLPDDRAWPRTDFSRRAVDLNEIESGGPPKDGIPAIDRPKLIALREADAWLDPREPIISLELGGEARGYPLQILIYHEIVNDFIAGVPVAVTFCPLCNASLVFDRRVDGKVLDFGTTGKLRKSDLVMYDRQTESWWQQFTGRGIVGHYSGKALRSLPSTIVPYAEFKAAYPQGAILSRTTGYSRPYGRNPYRGYDRIGENPFLFRDPTDKRLPAMERVISVTENGRQRVYPFTALKAEPVINDELAGLPIVIMSKEGTLSVLDEEFIRDSRVVPSATAFQRKLDQRVLEFEARGGKIYDKQTGSQWNLLGQAVEGPLKGRRLAPVENGIHFAFAWLAFNPGSEIYSPAKSSRSP